MEERLQKILAHAGVASRRACEELILQGKVKVDGQVVAQLGSKFDPAKCRIEVEGKLLSGKEKPEYILLYKPAGYLTTVKDPRGRRTVLDLLPEVNKRVYPVGRLDYDTSGVLLLSNDGELTNNLIHPSKKVPKTYRVRVEGVPPEPSLNKLRRGIMLEDGKTAPAKIVGPKVENNYSFIDITIYEGKNRQVRRMFEAIGYPALSLKRISFGFLDLSGLKPGEWRHLTAEEVARLKKTH